MKDGKNSIPAKAVSNLLTGDGAEAMELVNDALWDGDTYSYSLKRGDEVLLRSYDGTEIRNGIDALEKGRKLCMEGDSKMYESIREFTDRQFFAEASDGTGRIGFVFKDQFITDPWIDESGRFELDDEKAVSKYGADNVALFIVLVSDRLSLYEFLHTDH